MKEELENTFPLSKNNVIKGSRRLIREKIMQIIFAHKMSETDFELLYNNIFNRDFNFGDEEEQTIPDKLLKPDEVFELEADVPIAWTKRESEYAHTLLSLTMKDYEEVDARIKSAANNWEIERISPIDSILIHLGVAEFMHFPDIPSKVTMNEMLEIAKKFSTPKSNIFINGVLNSILLELTEEGKVVKTGRGLRQ